MNHRDGTVLTQEKLVEKLEQQTAPKISPEILESLIEKTDYLLHEGTSLTVCVLTLKNGFTVTGESACADPANFDAEVGRTIARRNAKDKMWSLAGYELKSKLKLIEAAGQPTGKILSFGSVTTHIGTKVIHAVPMTRGHYNHLRGWQLPENENADDAGFLVQYADGGLPNLPEFSGYVSWSPRDVFERAYAPGTKQKQESFLDRLIKEEADLSVKCTKLADFLNSNGVFSLGDVEFKDLTSQLQVMRQYQVILRKRLDRLRGLTA